MARRHETAGLAYDDAQLSFGVHVVRKFGRREFDVLARLKHAGRRLHETARLFGLHGLNVFGVRAVVEADAPDLRRHRVGKSRRDLAEWNCGDAGGFDLVRARADDSEQIVGDPRPVLRIDFRNGRDALACQHACMSLALIEECEEFHGGKAILHTHARTARRTSTRSMKTPYAVCSTAGEIESVPIVPIRSVWSRSTFDVP